MDEILKNLNEPQREALKEINTPVLILAGAGSGKTRVITYKLAYLIKHYGIPPWNILAVTFTNKAAGEMKHRAISLIEQAGQDVEALFRNTDFWISTFHSACGRILRRDIDKIGYNSNFTIYDTEDSKRLIKEVIVEKGFTKFSEKLPLVLSLISKSKNKLESPKELIKRSEHEGNDYLLTIGKIYEVYERKLYDYNALDFDNMILKTIELFEKEPQVLEKYCNYFQYIMVDEFQDTNLPQYKLIKQLVGERGCVSVVGDDDQSIYSWRGAEIKNILNFQKDYKDCKIVKLEQNYRSSTIILDASHSVVKNNPNRFEKKLWSELGEGETIKFYSAYDDLDEGYYVISKILELREAKEPYKSMAIFYRTNSQSRIFEEKLTEKSIPYRVFGGIRFYDRREVKDVLAYLVVIANSRDNISLKRVINVPKRGIGDMTVKKIEDVAIEKNKPIMEVLSYCVENVLKGKAKKNVEDFVNLINDMRQLLKEGKSVYEVSNKIVEKINYYEYLKSEEDWEDRINNIDELFNSMREYDETSQNPSLEDYLTNISLKADVDNKEVETDNYVSIMTLHNSKGLEFSNIFITGLDEGIFPIYQSLEDEEQLFEERRLFYVGLTRAKKRCFLSSLRRRFTFGSEKTFATSRFIKEIDSDLIEEDEVEVINNVKNRIKKKKKEVDKNLDRADVGKKIDDISKLNAGDLLFHPEFGICSVVKTNSRSNISTILLEFENGTRRQFIFKFVELYELTTNSFSE